MSQKSTYAYHELSHGEIRVMTVLPGKFGDTIIVGLNHVNLDHPILSFQEACGPVPYRHTILYEALSYVWGSKIRTHRVECNDGSHLEVTESLHLALQYLRHQNCERYVWADAVCINQFDLTERGSPFAIMADIYRKAHR